MTRTLAFLYGLVCYGLFLISFCYAMGFTEGVVVPTQIDAPPANGSFWHSIIVDLVLLGLFAVQHSLMARPGFKARWTRVVPKPLERSTYVLLSSVLLLLLTTQWQALPQTVWSVDNAPARLLLLSLSWAGWATVLLSSFLINHFDLFGLRQVYLHLRSIPYSDLPFVHASIYRIVRHPLMLGFLVAFWAAPRMSVGHLLFSVATTGYIFVGIWFEERDLLHAHGDAYREYQRDVSMVLPIRKRGRSAHARHPAALQ